jgi:hypothetical protein
MLFLFAYALYHDAVSSTNNVAQVIECLANNELERMWKETIVTQVQVLS